eukprot:349906-Chlamydomonas_euryale.AAC.8
MLINMRSHQSTRDVELQATGGNRKIGQDEVKAITRMQHLLVPRSFMVQHVWPRRLGSSLARTICFVATRAEPLHMGIVVRLAICQLWHVPDAARCQQLTPVLPRVDAENHRYYSGQRMVGATQNMAAGTITVHKHAALFGRR